MISLTSRKTKTAALVLTLTMFLGTNLYAGKSKQEYYSDRPDILTLEPASDSTYEQDSDLDHKLKGMLMVIAMLVEAYPENTQFYFLARDAEYAYDIARALTSAEPEIQDRFHLINVSTATSFDRNLPKYLEQEGISEKALRSGQNFAFVETGFMGTVPDEITRLFSMEFRGQFDTVMMESESSKHPSLKAFKHFMDAGNLEAWPHYTETGSEIKRRKGMWDVASKPNRSSKRQRAIERMEFIAKFAQENVGFFEEARVAWRALLEKKKGGKKKAKKGTKFALSSQIKTDFERKVQACRFCDYYKDPRSVDLDESAVLKELGNLGRSKSKAKDLLIELMVLERYQEIEDNRDKFKKALGGHVKYIDYLNYVIFVLNPRITPELESLLIHSLELITWDDYEVFEDLITSILPFLLEDASLDFINSIFDQAIYLKTEETLEKLINALSRSSDRRIKRHEEQLRKVIDDFSDQEYKDLTQLSKLFAENIFTDDRIHQMPDLFKHFVDQLFDNSDKKNKFDWRARLNERGLLNGRECALPLETKGKKK